MEIELDSRKPILIGISAEIELFKLEIKVFIENIRQILISHPCLQI